MTQLNPKEKKAKSRQEKAKLRKSILEILTSEQPLSWNGIVDRCLRKMDSKEKRNLSTVSNLILDEVYNLNLNGELSSFSPYPLSADQIPQTYSTVFCTLRDYECERIRPNPLPPWRVIIEVPQII